MDTAVTPEDAGAFLELLACAVASYATRCGVWHGPDHVAWARAFALRAASALGVELGAAALAIATGGSGGRGGGEAAAGGGGGGGSGGSDSGSDWEVVEAPEYDCASRGAALGPGPGVACLARVVAACIAGGSYDARCRAVARTACGACGGAWASVLDAEVAAARRGAAAAGGALAAPPLTSKRAVSAGALGRTVASGLAGGAVLFAAGAVTAPMLGLAAAATEGAAAAVGAALGTVGAGVSGLKARRRFRANADGRPSDWEVAPLSERAAAAAGGGGGGDDDASSLDGAAPSGRAPAPAGAVRGVPRFFLVAGWDDEEEEASAVFGSGGARGAPAAGPPRAPAPRGAPLEARDASWDELVPSPPPPPPLVGDLSGLEIPPVRRDGDAASASSSATDDAAAPGEGARPPLSLEACGWWGDLFPRTAYERVVYWERPAPPGARAKGDFNVILESFAAARFEGRHPHLEREMTRSSQG